MYVVPEVTRIGAGPDRLTPDSLAGSSRSKREAEDLSRGGDVCPRSRAPLCPPGVTVCVLYLHVHHLTFGIVSESRCEIRVSFFFSGETVGRVPK